MCKYQNENASNKVLNFWHILVIQNQGASSRFKHHGGFHTQANQGLEKTPKIFGIGEICIITKAFFFSDADYVFTTPGCWCYFSGNKPKLLSHLNLQLKFNELPPNFLHFVTDKYFNIEAQ